MIDFGVRDLNPSRIPPRPVLRSAGDRSVLLARIVALSIDLVLCYVLIEIPLLYLVLELVPGSLEALETAAVGLSLLGLIPVYLTYSFYFEWRRSRTPGKGQRGLMVAMTDGRPCTLRASAVRNLLRYVDFLGIPPIVLGLLSAIVSPTGRRIGDRAAGTLVVRTGAPGPRRPIDFDHGDRGEPDRDDQATRTPESGSNSFA